MMPRVGKGKKPLTVILSEDTYDAMKMVAEHMDWSISQTARNLIERALDNKLVPIDPPKPGLEGK
jgi:hypothetical protein